MATPTNAALIQGPNLDTMVDANHELWSVTSHFLVPKGTNLETLLAQLAEGKLDPNLDMSNFKNKVVDLTKIS